jgi:hypothetical protein
MSAAALLRAAPETLFAMVDAARDPAALPLLLASQARWESLFEGDNAFELADVAPYLVELPAGAPLLDVLLEAGFGRAWGAYLTSLAGFDAVRAHFAAWTRVQDPHGGPLPVFFRFYDPRVLGPFLTSLTAEECARFYGPARRFFFEGPGGAEVHEAAFRAGLHLHRTHRG